MLFYRNKKEIGRRKGSVKDSWEKKQVEVWEKKLGSRYTYLKQKMRFVCSSSISKRGRKVSGLGAEGVEAVAGAYDTDLEGEEKIEITQNYIYICCGTNDTVKYFHENRIVANSLLKIQHSQF